MPLMQFWKGEDLSNWLLKDQKTLYEPHYGIHLKNDPDYTAALLQANPHHAPFLQAVFPTGEMFQPLARFMLRVGRPCKSPFLAPCIQYASPLGSDRSCHTLHAGQLHQAYGRIGMWHQLEWVVMVQVRPDLEETVQDFKRKYFRPFTVGLQIRCSPPHARCCLESAHRTGSCALPALSC